MSERKYSVEGFPSGTHWVKSTTGTNLHCGYWEHPRWTQGAILRQRNSHERNTYIHELVQALNEMQEQSWIPRVWLTTITYVKSDKTIKFIDPFFGTLTLFQYAVTEDGWIPQDIPQDFWDDMEKLTTQVLTCDKEEEQ